MLHPPGCRATAATLTANWSRDARTASSQLSKSQKKRRKIKAKADAKAKVGLKPPSPAATTVPTPSGGPHGVSPPADLVASPDDYPPGKLLSLIRLPPTGALAAPHVDPPEDSVRQWAIDKYGNVTGHVSEEAVRASLLQLAVNVAAGTQQPGGCSKDDLFEVLEDPLCLLYHFLTKQLEDDDDPENAIDDGRYEDILRSLGINSPLPVLNAMECVTDGRTNFDLTKLDEALQAISDPDSRDEDGSDEDDDSDNDDADRA